MQRIGSIGCLGATLAAAVLAAAQSVAAQPAFVTKEADPWCRDQRRERGREIWCEVREASLRDPGRAITVDARPNGEAKARGDDRGDVLVRAKVVARGATQAEARALAAKIQVLTEPAITAQGPQAPHGRDYWVSFEVVVPRRTDLVLRAGNGPVSISDINGRVEMETQNGPVAIRRSAGHVTGRTQNGPLDVELDGDGWRGEGLDVETVNGPVVLSMPEGYNAELETGTVNGPLDLDLPIKAELRRNKRDIRATLGNGGAPVRVRTTNGPLSLRQR